MSQTCLTCNGSGKVPSIGMIDRLCPTCSGKRKVVEESTQIEVNAPERKKPGPKPKVPRET